MDGWSGCFRGISAKVGVVCASSFTVQIVREHLENKKDKYALLDDSLDPEERKRKDFLDSLSVELIAHTAGVIVSHPFQVICVRMMAEFVGGENQYRFV